MTRDPWQFKNFRVGLEAALAAVAQTRGDAVDRQQILRA